MGGAVIPDLGAIHPALYHQGLLQAARDAGVRVFTHAAVTALAAGKGAGATSRGTIIARGPSSPPTATRRGTCRGWRRASFRSRLRWPPPKSFRRS
jgi:glycine/D-amino acid oxidase-like deaminating enzyme